MKRVILIPKEKSYDEEYLQNILKQASSISPDPEGDPNGQHACCSGKSMEFRIEEEAITSDEEVFKINPVTGKLEEYRNSTSE